MCTGRSKDDRPIPCDILLLRGSCISDESMLTGESVPVMKESVEEMTPCEVLDLDSHSKLRLLFGGTSIVQHSPPTRGDNGLRGKVISSFHVQFLMKQSLERLRRWLQLSRNVK